MSTSSNPVVDKLYYLSEKSGEIWGKLAAGIINTTSSVTTIGIEAIKKSNSKFVENVKPAYNDAKDTINGKMYNVVPEKYQKYFKKENELNENIEN